MSTRRATHLRQRSARSSLKNGELLQAAEPAGLLVLVTTDTNLKHQQNLAYLYRQACTPHWRSLRSDNRKPFSA